MRVVIYAPSVQKVAVNLTQTVQAVIPDGMAEVYEGIEEFTQRLCKPLLGEVTAVLLAATPEELSCILSIRHLLRRVRIILILPNQEQNTLTRGYSLQPRFLAFVDDDFMNIAAVLNKMLENPSPEKKTNEEPLEPSPYTELPIDEEIGFFQPAFLFT